MRYNFYNNDVTIIKKNNSKILTNQCAIIDHKCIDFDNCYIVKYLLNKKYNIKKYEKLETIF